MYQHALVVPLCARDVVVVVRSIQYRTSAAAINGSGLDWGGGQVRRRRHQVGCIVRVLRVYQHALVVPLCARDVMVVGLFETGYGLWTARVRVVRCKV